MRAACLAASPQNFYWSVEPMDRVVQGVKRSLQALLAAVFACVFVVNGFCVDIILDGLMSNSEWESAQVETIVKPGDSSNCSVTYAAMKWQICSDESAAYFVFAAKCEALERDNQLCGFSVKLENTDAVIATAKNSPLTFNADLYHIDACVLVNTDQGVVCEMRIGFKRGIPEKTPMEIRIIDAFGEPSTVYNYILENPDYTEPTAAVLAPETTEATTTKAPKTTKVTTTKAPKTTKVTTTKPPKTTKATTTKVTTTKAPKTAKITTTKTPKTTKTTAAETSARYTRPERTRRVTTTKKPERTTKKKTTTAAKTRTTKVKTQTSAKTTATKESFPTGADYHDYWAQTPLSPPTIQYTQDIEEVKQRQTAVGFGCGVALTLLVGWALLPTKKPPINPDGKKDENEK